MASGLTASRSQIVQVFLGLTIFGIWTLPILWLGFTNSDLPFVGKYLNHNWRIACLFPCRSNSWDDYFYQVRSRNGVWTEVPYDILGEMRPFGAGNRIHRIMAQGGGDRNREAVLKSVAVFIKRASEESGLISEVGEVRFLRLRHEVGSSRLIQQDGPWTIPTLEEVGEENAEVWRHYKFPDQNGVGS